MRHLLLVLLLVPAIVFAQHDTLAPEKVPASYVDKIGEKAASIDKQLDKKTDKLLSSLQKQEERMRRKLARKDSAKAAELFGDTKAKYDGLRDKLSNIQSGSYNASIDTMATSLQFLQQNGIAKNVTQSLDKVKGLQQSFAQAESVQQFIKERRAQLKDQLLKMGWAKELKQLNKQVYYYQSQVAEYKELLKDHKKAEKKALEMLSKTRVFRDFMKRNSMLASLFRTPGQDGGNAASLAGLQTRTEINNLIENQLAAGGPAAREQFRNNLQQAQSQLNSLKDKINKAGGNGEVEMPEGFKPNNQKNKSFFQRLEYSTQVQSRKGNGYLPTSTDLGLSVGYKINDKSIVGIGMDYSMGWGHEGIRKIRISHQGIGFRSFVDVKLKGSFWLSGGYEQHHRAEFKRWEELQGRNAWQQSGLIGVSKVVSLQSKVFKKTSIKLLWDFLSYRQVPRTQQFLFRVGYNF